MMNIELLTYKALFSKYCCENINYSPDKISLVLVAIAKFK